MRRIILSLLAVIVVLGLFAATGYAGYRAGYAQGAQIAPAAANGDQTGPGLRPFDRFGPREIPDRSFKFEREFHRGFGMGGFPGRGFGFFAPLRFLAWIAVLALLGASIYWLFARGGYRVVRTTTVHTVETPPAPPPVETDRNET